MRKKITISITIFLLLIQWLQFPLQIAAQKNLKKPAAVSFTRKEYNAIIDSLYSSNTELKTVIETAEQTIQAKDSVIGTMQEKIRRLDAKVNTLSQEIENAQSQNLKLDQSNRILIIFNSVVGVLLLSTLVWFLRNIGKKKSPSKTGSDSGSQNLRNAEIKSNAIIAGNSRFYESKLEQLERLGKLKEKGVLNDEEFNSQKLKILSSN